MHVLMTVNAAWNIRNFRMPLVQSFLAAGHRVTVLAPHDDAVAALQAAGCDVQALQMDVKGLNPVRDLGLALRLRRHFRAARPDVILGFTIKNNLFGALAAKTLGIPFIPNVTGLGTAFLSGGLLQAVAETLYRRAFAGLPVVFFQNEDDRALFVQRRLVRADQARLLPGSGIDLAHFSAAPWPAPTGETVFLMIARLLRDKGVLEYVEAARKVKARHPEARFQLLGPIAAENRSAIAAETLNEWVAEGVIDYLGSTEDVRPMIAAAQCVVLPSYREGAPRTLIEAAALARPLIATDVPGCRAVVQRDRSGFLCAPRDARSLADAIERFLALPTDARMAMGQEAREHMERDYDQKLVVAAYREAIAQLTKARTG